MSDSAGDNEYDLTLNEAPEPMDLDEGTSPPRTDTEMIIGDDSHEARSSGSTPIRYIARFPPKTATPQIIVPTLKELGFRSSDYVKARPQRRPQVVQVLREVEEDNGDLSYRVRLGDGAVTKVRESSRVQMQG